MFLRHKRETYLIHKKKKNWEKWNCLISALRLQDCQQRSCSCLEELKNSNFRCTQITQGAIITHIKHISSHRESWPAVPFCHSMSISLFPPLAFFPLCLWPARISPFLLSTLLSLVVCYGACTYSSTGNCFFSHAANVLSAPLLSSLFLNSVSQQKVK